LGAGVRDGRVLVGQTGGVEVERIGDDDPSSVGTGSSWGECDSLPSNDDELSRLGRVDESVTKIPLLPFHSSIFWVAGVFAHVLFTSLVPDGLAAVCQCSGCNGRDS